MMIRWWLVLAVAFVACLGMVAAQGARPWARFDERPAELGTGPGVTHAAITYRLVSHDVTQEVVLDSDEPRRAVPGARLVTVVVEQRQAGPEPRWEFCNLRLGTPDGLVWADEPDGYGRPDGLPRESGCATDEDVPPPGEPYQFGRIFMIPAEYAETANVVLTLPDGRITLTRN